MSRPTTPPATASTAPTPASIQAPASSAAPSALQIARRRMASLETGTGGACRVIFDFDPASQPEITDHHAFRTTLGTVAHDEALDFAAVAADQILFCLDGTVAVEHGADRLLLRRWDLLSLQAGLPVRIVGADPAASRCLLVTADPAAYRAAGRMPTVSGPLDSRRVGRWGEVKGYDDAFVTSATPGLEKRVFKLLNRGISQGAHLLPALAHEFPFTMSIVQMEADKGATLHSHATEEVFIALDGHFDLHWGDDASGRIRMARHDLLSMPTQLMRGFRNGNGRRFHMLVFVGGWNQQSQTSVTYVQDEFNTATTASAR